jgi:elongation factor G
MGELHLEVYIERMKREYGAVVTTSPPQVAYRETITQEVKFNYTHKKQTGGSGQYGKVIGSIAPNEEANFTFENTVKGGNVPKEYISSVEKGFRSMMDKGLLTGFPVVGISVILRDGSAHSVDSSEMAFQEAARGAWRSVYHNAKPAILEPLMKVEVEGPSEFHGSIVGTLMQRRGQIAGSSEEDGFSRVEAFVPLAEMFGYATDLRSCTQGKANFTMEFKNYSPVPQSVKEEVIEKFGKKKES